MWRQIDACQPSVLGIILALDQTSFLHTPECLINRLWFTAHPLRQLHLCQPLFMGKEEQQGILTAVQAKFT